MHPWEEAARRGERMIRDFESTNAGNGVRYLGKLEESRVTQWLTDDVVPLLQSITARPRFRELATWSLTNLCTTSQSDDRQTVINLEFAVRNFAEAFHRLIILKSTQKLLKAVVPTPELTSETITIRANSVPKRISAQYESDASSNSIEPFLKSLLTEPQPEFFRPEDYFLSQQEFKPWLDGRRLPNGILVPGLWSRLEPLGDLIARTGRQRIESCLNILSDSWKVLLRLPLSAHVKTSTTFKDALAAKSRLDGCWMTVRSQVFEHPDARRIDSCATLTQVYASFAANPNLNWLKVPHDSIASSRCLPSFIRGRHCAGLLDRICRSLRDVGDLYEPITAATSEQEDAIARGDLVMIEAENKAYWNRQSISFRKRHKSWSFLWKLAEHASTRMAVTESDLYPDRAACHSALATARSRLSEVLPPDLDDRIECAPDQLRAYRLNLDSDRIRLIRRVR